MKEYTGRRYRFNHFVYFLISEDFLGKLSLYLFHGTNGWIYNIAVSTYRPGNLDDEVQLLRISADTVIGNDIILKGECVVGYRLRNNINI